MVRVTQANQAELGDNTESSCIAEVKLEIVNVEGTSTGAGDIVVTEFIAEGSSEARIELLRLRAGLRARQSTRFGRAGSRAGNRAASVDRKAGRAGLRTRDGASIGSCG